jgi:Lrp/AsnC family transcriptional regulator
MEKKNLAEFEKLIMSYDEVTECYTMAGTMDFMLRIISQGIEGYEHFVRDNLLSLEYVQEVHSNVTMTCVKRSTSLPL